MPTRPLPFRRPVPTRRHRTRTVLLVLGFALVVAASCVSAPGLLVIADHGAHAASGPSCGAAIAKANGTYWTCTFDDEFSGGLDTGKWTAVSTAKTNFHTGPECYVNDRRHVNVSFGALTLTATKSPTASSCGRFSTPYQSGMITSSGMFSQAYGRWEVRAKLPSAAGLQPAIWLNPQRLTYGPWPYSGEIDIAEGLMAGTVSPHLHYVDYDGTAANPGAYCDVANISTRYHKYVLVWTPKSMTFTIDGSACWSVTSWKPRSPQRMPQPFDQPFTVLLQLALGYMSGNSVQASTPFPAVMKVDYVRVWK